MNNETEIGGPPVFTERETATPRNSSSRNSSLVLYETEREMIVKK